MHALLGGHVDVHRGLDRLGRAGERRTRLRLLVTWGAQRTKRWPNVPTLKELGYAIVSNSPYGIAGPKGMDPAVVKTLHDAFKKALDDPGCPEEMLGRLDQATSTGTARTTRRFAKKSIEEEQKAVRALGLKM